MKSLPAVTIDGIIYALIALFTALSAAFTTDDAAKYIAPYILFWCKTGCTINSATLLAIKMYRSTAYAEHLKKTNGGHTDFFGREETKETKPT